MAVLLLILFIVSIVIGYYIILLLRSKSKYNLETLNKIRLFDDKQNYFIYQFALLMVNIGYINKAKSKLTIRFVFPGKDSEYIERDYTSFISDINKFEKEQKLLLKDIKREVEKIPINISNDFSSFINQSTRKEGIIEILVFVEGIMATLIIGLIINLIRLSVG